MPLAERIAFQASRLDHFRIPPRYASRQANSNTKWYHNRMKIVIFAGGSGTRFWPLSRKIIPKQFKRIFDGKSTLQLAVERVEKTFGIENIYISTNEKYTSLVKDQIPQIPTANIVGEPERRDVAAAIGYNLIRLQKLGYSGSVAILWSDHLMKNPKNFVSVLKSGEKLIKENPKQLVFVGEKPRYAENNLGWIHIGKQISQDLYKYVEWYYKPPLEKCKKMFKSGEWVWNPGYWIVDLDFVVGLYKKHMPGMYKKLMQIQKAVGTTEEAHVLRKIYPTLEPIHFDNAIVEKVPAEQAVVLVANMGWSDPGSLYALKEALVGNGGKNFNSGMVYDLNTTDSLLINEEKNKVLATIGLKNMVVVNTEDALIVVHKDNVLEISDLIKKLEEDDELKKFV